MEEEKEFSSSDDFQMDESEDELEEEQGEEQQDQDAQKDEKISVYLPGQSIESDHELVADPSAYVMLHPLHMEWPALSFDVIPGGSPKFPMSLMFVTGSQADENENNKISIIKASGLNKTFVNPEEDDDDESDDESQGPVLESRDIPHSGGINRIRRMPHAESHIVSTWADTGLVHLYNITSHVSSFDTLVQPAKETSPLYTIRNHGSVEGYGMDWSNVTPGSLLTGDMSGKIYLTTKSVSGFTTQNDPFIGHQGSIEDIQWSPKEANVFTSCSSDKTIRVWDTRVSKKSQLSIVAHDCDVNVLSWSRCVDYLLASGCDSGNFKVWDLRNWGSAEPVPAASFSWHTEQITSIEWHPTESSVLGAAGGDNQISLWDLALEKEEDQEDLPTQVPPQLLFIHQGQTQIKEFHWHTQIPGLVLSTAFDGMHLFKTINI